MDQNGKKYKVMDNEIYYEFWVHQYNFRLLSQTVRKKCLQKLISKDLHLCTICIHVCSLKIKKKKEGKEIYIFIFVNKAGELSQP